MAQRGIREYDAKRMLARALDAASTVDERLVLVTPETDLDGLPAEHSWLGETKLVCKPDQLFGKRGKNDLLYVDKSFAEVKQWIAKRMNRETTIEGAGGKTTGVLTHFLIEPFVPHEVEYYVAFTSKRDADVIHFSTEGGVDIESVWDTVIEIEVPILGTLDRALLEKRLPELPEKEKIVSFIEALYRVYVEYHFATLELNPFTFSEDGALVPLDCVAKLDDTAAYQCAERWGAIEFPKPFGTTLTKEEAYVKSLDEKTGASLKLTVLNPNGRVWLLVAGGGASVIYADTVVDLGYGEELANYGEYSGDPSTELTFEYTKTVLDLMTRTHDSKGRPKFLIIGGGIIQALEAYKEKLQENRVRIYVRRGGPNYVEGLEKMRRAGERIGVPIEVYGPETHMTAVVSMALQGGR
jgi:ATP-citrate lyase beta-subunit